MIAVVVPRRAAWRAEFDRQLVAEAVAEGPEREVGEFIGALQRSLELI